MATINFKKGDLVKTVYGDIEEVMRADEVQVITYESARKLSWWHPSKVWLVE